MLLGRSLGSAALLFCLAQPATAQKATDDGPAKAAQPHDEEASTAFQAAFERVAAFLKSRETYQVEAREQWKTVQGGDSEEGASTYELAVERPGKFAIRVKPQGATAPLLEVVSADPAADVVAVFRQPDKVFVTRVRRDNPIEGLRRNPVLGQCLAGSFLDILIRPDLAEYVAGSISGVVDLGVEDVSGTPTRHFRGRWADGREADFWIAEGDDAVLVRLRFARTLMAAAEPGSPPARFTSTVQYQWMSNQAIPADLFRLEPPDGSVEVDDLYAALTGAGASLTVGKPAPELDLELLGGGKLKLADHIGKDVVVLNFWATWYPTGVDSLPTIAAFEREYGPKGFKFYHVNMAEPVELVERFVSSLDDKLTVAVDPEGKAMETYSVLALPFSVVIAKDGTIKAVNAGDLRGFRDRFREQLDGLVEAKPPDPQKEP